MPTGQRFKRTCGHVTDFGQPIKLEQHDVAYMAKSRCDACRKHPDYVPTEAEIEAIRERRRAAGERWMDKNGNWHGGR